MSPTIVFFGNTKYSKIVEEALHKKFKLAAVVTTPDKPKGRNRKLTPSPTKEFAQKSNIPVLEIEKVESKQIAEIAKFDADFFVVADYGLILPLSLLKLPKFDSLNVHHSLLPKYRGPSPAPTTILNGDKISGVTIISMTYDVDAGDILAQEKYQLTEDETCDSLLTKLNGLGAELVLKVIQNYQSYKAKKTKQNEDKATYTHRFTKADGQIDPQDPPAPQILDRMIRAFYPWPSVWTELKWKVPVRRSLGEGGESRKWKVLKIKLLPSTVLPSYRPTDPFAIQPEGKRPMSINQFVNGYPQSKQLLEKLHFRQSPKSYN